MYKPKIIPIILYCLLTACANIPLSTMLAVSDFNEQSFLDMEPDNIRVKLTINSAVECKPAEHVTITASVTHREGEFKTELILQEIIVNTVAAKEGWFGSTPSADIFDLALTAQSIDDFRKLQHLISNTNPNPNPTGAGFGVGIHLGTNLELTDEDVIISVAIKLSQYGDYLVLLDELNISPE